MMLQINVTLHTTHPFFDFIKQNVYCISINICDGESSELYNAI
jgi:hypothetical protein